MECEDKAKKQSEMVASLQSRRKALETKIREKNDELKNLCIQEAELTGILPPETPLEPGESPPVFRRRMGTAFAIPENLFNKMKSKEEESLANLELECKIQTSIAEAALGLANDGTVSKSVRRKHRLMYQQSQRRLIELEAKLNLLRQNNRIHLKQRKKPRPPLESENDCVDGNSGSGNVEKLETKNQPYHPALSYTVSDKGPIRHSFPVNNFNRIPDAVSAHRQLELNYSCNPWQQHYTNELQERDKYLRSGVGGQLNRDQMGWSGEALNYNNINNHQRVVRQNVTNINEIDRGTQFRDRFGSLDRRRLSMGGHQLMNNNNNNNNEDLEHHHSRSNHVINMLIPPNQPYQPNTSQINSVLLPNQTYPENSLMRTQSLGSVELTKSDPDTRSLKSNPHHSCFDSLKPESSRNSKLDFQNHNFNDPNKFHNDGVSSKSESNEMFKARGKFDTEQEYLKNLSSLENLKFEHNLYPNRGYHHNHYIDHGKYDLKPVVEGSTLNMYSQSHHDLNVNVPSFSMEAKEVRKHDLIKSEAPTRHHEFHSHRSSEALQYHQRAPETGRHIKYSHKSELRPPHYHEERSTTEVVQAICVDSLHHESTSRSETAPEPTSKRYEPQPADHPEVINRKTRDKEWYETSLDSRQSNLNDASQTPPLPPQFSSPPPPPLPPPPRAATPNCLPQQVIQNSPQQVTQQPVDFDTVVPFESPKNHTVVQAGKWQPYREVTKPFEMADFYKYSTKFRNKSAIQIPPTSGGDSSSPQSNSQLSPQHKGVYKPLKSMTCQPISNNSPSSNDGKNPPDVVDSPSANLNSSQIQSPPSLANAFSTEMLAWYQDQSAPQTRSATLV